ncbi:radical SAM protein [Nocardia iowensis]|uniref:Radical SAM core domain-containing protein n=1 Tax=Nocardia iowensis TaxID=204891 RepID=A0ABX8RFE3_NOCIO|nr:radical SAM protein [Nocardia iowensis]QXN88315.1 hypothetical protein KV110_22175 [Nocardia iowensis]
MLHLLALEINVVTHCNLSCVGCSHSSPAAAEGFADVATVGRDFSALADVVEPVYVRLVGGEPLLHPELDQIIGAIRSAMPHAIIRLYTNGTRIDKGTSPWLAALDELLVSVYPRAAVPDSTLRHLAAECATANTTLLVERFFAFRASRPTRQLTATEARQVFQTCQMAHAKSAHIVQDGHVYLCPMSAPATIARHDGPSCRIEPHDTLEHRLSAFLNRKDPLAKCHNCLGTVGSRLPHAMASRKTWVELSTRGEIDYSHMDVLLRDPDSNNFCSVAETW